MSSFKVQQSEQRCGMLRGESWIQYKDALTKEWGTKGGYNLSTKENGPGPFTFNYWSGDKNAVMEFEEEEVTDSKLPVATERKPDAKIETASLPYLARTAVKERPSFLIFDVTGHVMFSIYFGNLRRPELHLLNPWDLKGTTQLKDVYALLDEKLKATARKIAIIDVVQELERKTGKTINLQKYERIGFCTLWVGIIANKVIPILSQLSEKKPIPLDLYQTEVYDPLEDALEKGQTEIVKQLPASMKLENLAAAKTVVSLAQGRGRKTYRKRKHSSKTKRKPMKWNRARRSTL